MGATAVERPHFSLSFRFILSGKGSWIHNPISPYNAALKEKMPIADDINHHNSPSGPAGTLRRTGVRLSRPLLAA